jgi:predicted CoA-binding protein
MDSNSHSDSQIKQIYQLKNIVVVGVSKNEEKPSHQVPKYLSSWEKVITNYCRY